MNSAGRPPARRLGALLAVTLGLTTLGVVTAAPASAAPPVNDNLASAPGVSLGTFDTTTAEATLETGEAAKVPTECGAVDHSVWYQYTAAPGDTDVLRLQTQALPATSSTMDTVITAYTSSSPGAATIASLTPVRCNDQNGVNNLSDVQFRMTGGTTYYIQVADYVGEGAGSGQGPVRLSLTKAPPPGNDDVAGSTTLTPGVTATTTTAFSTLQAGEDDETDCADIYDSVWMKWTPGESTLADVSVTSTDPAASSVVNVYSGSSATIAALTPVACGVDFAQFSASSGTTYYLQISDEAGPGGHFPPGGKSVHLITGSRPANDALAAATTVTSPSTTQVDNTFGSLQMEEKQPTGTGCNDMGHTVWLKYTAPASGDLLVETLGGATAPDTNLAVWSGPASGPTFAALTLVACNDDGGPGTFSLVNTTVTAGATYYVQVGTYGTDRGAFDVHLVGPAVQPPPPPQRSATTTTLSAPKKVKWGKKATVSVSVTTAAGAPAAGSVTVTIGGKATTVTLVAGKASVTSKKLKKPGKITVTAAYAETATTLASSAEATVKVKKKPKPPPKD